MKGSFAQSMKYLETGMRIKNHKLSYVIVELNLITELFYKNVQEFKIEFPNALSVYVLPNDVERTKAELKARKLEASDLSKRLKDIDDELTFFYSNRNLFDIVITNDYTEKSCLLLQQLIEQKIRSD